MTKGIIEVHIPSSCLTCDLCYEADYDPRYRIAGERTCVMNKVNVDEYSDSRPSWCPIKRTSIDE